MSFARNAYAGHAKAPVVPLAAPGRYERIVKKNLLQAGVVAPAQAPPGGGAGALIRWLRACAGRRTRG
jgi:hypothetical protein